MLKNNNIGNRTHYTCDTASKVKHKLLRKQRDLAASEKVREGSLEKVMFKLTPEG